METGISLAGEEPPRRFTRRDLVDQRRDELAILIRWQRDVLPTRLGDKIALLVNRRCRGGDDPGSGSFDPCGEREVHADERGLAKSDGQLAAEAEPLSAPGGGPDHGLVEDGCENAAMGDAGETDVGRAGRESRGDVAGGFINEQVQVEAVRIFATADEAAGGVGKFESSGIADCQLTVSD